MLTNVILLLRTFSHRFSAARSNKLECPLNNAIDQIVFYSSEKLSFVGGHTVVS